MKTQFNTILLLMFIVPHTWIKAQSHQDFQPPIPVEVMVGHQSTNFQMIVSKNLGKAHRFNFFNLTTFDENYSEYAPDFYLIKSIGSYNISRSLGLGLGANFSSDNGLRPLIAATYVKAGKNATFLFQPSYELHQDGMAELFAMYEWCPRNTKAIQPYFRGQIMSSFNQSHIYSYHYWRVGIQYKSVRIGPAANFQIIGSEQKTQNNFGGFINIILP